MNRPRVDELHDTSGPGAGAADDRGARIRRRRYARPPVDIYATETEMVVLADVPGVRKGEMNVALEGDELVIEGPVSGRQQEESALPWGYYRRFKLRTAFERGRIAAHLEGGILKVTLPKTAAQSSQNIPID
ncbi:MAG: Hsp20/alpha crystallin family protein [Gemmatimonadota bacterium]|nr:MAG: Hsp20/alpha crystallin family protein [Gemmatimonadota bacterium]